MRVGEPFLGRQFRVGPEGPPGWFAVRERIGTSVGPIWQFVGIYPEREAAEAAARELGTLLPEVRE